MSSYVLQLEVQIKQKYKTIVNWQYNPIVTM